MIKPVKTKRSYEAALKRINVLLEAKKGTDAFDELEVLTILVENYESKQHQITAPDPIEAIKFRLEQMDLTRKDLEPCLGSRARVSEILNRKRDLTLRMIRALHHKLGIPPEALLG